MKRGLVGLGFGIAVALSGCGGQNSSLAAPTPNYQASSAAPGSNGQLNPGMLNATVKAALASTPLDGEPVDTAVWVNPKDSGSSLVLVTAGNSLVALGPDGKVVQKVDGLKNPRGVDVQYGLKLGDSSTDIALVAEAGTQSVRVFRMDAKARKLVDVTGETKVFQGEKATPDQLGIYRDKSAFFAFVSREPAPQKDCLGQFKLVPNGSKVDLKWVRSLGELEEPKPELQPPSQPAAAEPPKTPDRPAPSAATVTASPSASIPALAPVKKPMAVTAIYVDSSKAKVYYTDPNYGVREYSAEPADKGASKVASGFARTGLAGILRGLALSKDHFVCLDEAAGGAVLHMFPRETRGEKTEAARTKTEFEHSNSVEIVVKGFGKGFPKGAAIVTDPATKTVQFYDWREVAKSAGLKD